MSTFREPDPLAAFLMRELNRVLACITRFANGEAASALAEARHILRGLADAENEVLYPAFTRVRLRLDMQHLLDDSRGDRGEQLAGLEALAHKRAPRLRKLAAVALSELIKRDAERHISQLIPVLSSQLPRPLYRSIVQAFIAHYEGETEVKLVHAHAHSGHNARRAAPAKLTG